MKCLGQWCWFVGGFVGAVSLLLLLANSPGRSPAEPTMSARSDPDSGAKSSPVTNSRGNERKDRSEPGSPTRSIGERLFLVEIQLLNGIFKCHDHVPSLSEADALTLAISATQTTEINRLLHEVMAKVQEIESRHVTVSADDAGNPGVAVLSWNDEAEPVILQLVEDLLSVTTPEQADFIARHFAAPALGDWGKGRRNFAILDWDGTEQLGILRQDPFQSGDDAPTLGTRLNYSRWKESIETRYSHILPYFPGIDG